MGHSTDHQQAESARTPAEEQEDQNTQQQKDEQSQEQHQHNGKPSEQDQQRALEHVKALLEHGRKVTVIGVSANPAKEDTYIVAGSATKQSTGGAQPVAVCIDKSTTVMRQTGEGVSPAVVPKLHEGETIVVDGKKSKRGVMRAKHVVI